MIYFRGDMILYLRLNISKRWYSWAEYMSWLGASVAPLVRWMAEYTCHMDRWSSENIVNLIGLTCILIQKGNFLLYWRTACSRNFVFANLCGQKSCWWSVWTAQGKIFVCILFSLVYIFILLFTIRLSFHYINKQ